ncbi:hypothetical protein JOF29_004560 [Kribbella aluminosa]|uniref:Uncharacterized protein n=1 Tax=Kribbella aluminosa TaxID=416017 RepID=A0ABS4UP90_9ACTN|nr:hypothetical protein [Kribbella aluminosa]MBP2353450.1 hypothetical protein [Kribbella aluminosa]
MQYIPFSVIKSIHEQTHSAMPDAPLRPHVPKRNPIRDAVIRWRERRTPPRELVCQAEDRDRGTTPAGVARAC